MARSLQQDFIDHWAMDKRAAATLSRRLATDKLAIQKHLGAINLPDLVAARDEYRKEIASIFAGTSKRRLICIGPCSLDVNVDYTSLFDYIGELQAHYPDALIAMRANGAKPRTSGGWKGLWYSVNKTERRRLFQIYNEAFKRKIPILTEITEGPQLGAFAPWLSAFWLGARDIESTTLRSIASLIHLPVGIKNSRDGSLVVLENALKAVQTDSTGNDDSGVDLGTIAASWDNPGVATGILPNESGNPHVAIFARGYDLPEGMTKLARQKAMYQHVSDTCELARKRKSAVIIDGSHSVPPMLNIDRKDPDRFLAVLESLHVAITKGRISNHQYIHGVLGEVGPVIGRTDPNLLIDAQRQKQLKELIGITVSL